MQQFKWWVLRASLSLVFCLLPSSTWAREVDQQPILVQGMRVRLVAQSTVSPTVTSPTIVATPTPTPQSVSYPEMLSAYKEVLGTTESVMESSQKSLESYLKWTTIIFGILTAAGVGGLWLIGRSIGEMQAKANEVGAELESTCALNEELRRLISEQEQSIQEHKSKVESLGAGLAQVEERIINLKKQAALALRDLDRVVPRLETLADVDTYAMRLFSTDSDVSRTARRALIELSKDDDPVVRRECIRVFGAMPDFPECFVDLQDPKVVRQLQMIAQTDPERGVQLEARRALDRLRTK